MKRLALVAMMAIALAGCANQNNMAWTKPNSSAQEFYQTRAQCMSMSGPGGHQVMNPGTGGGAFGTGFNQGFNQMSAAMAQRQQGQIFDDCMRGQGWRLVRQ